MGLLQAAEFAQSRGYKSKAPSREVAELAVKYFAGEVSATDAGFALGIGSNAATYHLAAVLRNAIRYGMASSPALSD